MNTTIKAIAIDDEQHCLDILKYELERNCPEVELIATFQDPKNAISKLADEDLSVLFLDIHLQSTSGIDFLQSIAPLPYPVVFVTAYDEYAIQAFELEAFHYLLKPINGQKLRQVVDRILTQEQESDQASVDRILKALAKSNAKEVRIPFSVNTGIEFVAPQDIVYVSGENNYSMLHFTNSKKLLVSKTLSSVEEILSNHSFLRIHKSSLINVNHIVRYVKTDGGHVEMMGGTQLPVSRSKKSTVNSLFS